MHNSGSLKHWDQITGLENAFAPLIPYHHIKRAPVQKVRQNKWQQSTFQLLTPIAKTNSKISLTFIWINRKQWKLTFFFKLGILLIYPAFNKNLQSYWKTKNTFWSDRVDIRTKLRYGKDVSYQQFKTESLKKKKKKLSHTIRTPKEKRSNEKRFSFFLNEKGSGSQAI